MTRINPSLRAFALATTLLALAGCARQQEEPAAESTEATTDAATPADAATAEPPKVVAAVEARISLSAAAKAELGAKGDRILVEAIYAGDPTPESQSQVNELGLIELGKTSQTIPGAGTVGFDKSSIDSARLPLIVGQPQVILNVRSEQGLLACPMYWESVKVASEKTVEITCSLPSEAGGNAQ